MKKTKYVNGARYLGALWIAGFLVAGCGTGTALAETDDDTALDESAREVSNNFGELLKGMGQELKKVIDSDDRTDSKASEKDGRKDAEYPDVKSGGNENSR
jgi:hypothetical protein